MSTHVKIELKKSWTNKFNKKYPVGQIVPCDPQLAKQLIDEGYGVKYTGKYPPEGKVKTEFFKPKKIK